MRAESRELGRPLNSTHLAGGLQEYSQRGQVYVDKVRSLSPFNKLAEFDTELVSVTPAPGSSDTD